MGELKDVEFKRKKERKRLVNYLALLDLLEVGPLVKGQREPWSDKSGKRLRWGCTEEESDADMTRPKSEGRPNNCTPRCPDTMILSVLTPLINSFSNLIFILFLHAYWNKANKKSPIFCRFLLSILITDNFSFSLLTVIGAKMKLHNIIIYNNLKILLIKIKCNLIINNFKLCSLITILW